MSANSSIEWTDRTWNPVRGCSVVSPGCVNCYAMKQAHRFSGPGKPYEGLTKLTKAGPQWTGKVRTIDAALLEPLSWRKPARVFVNSMSDLFHEDVPDEFVAAVFAVMAVSERHTFQVLTKRPDRMLAWFRWLDRECRLRDDFTLQPWQIIEDEAREIVEDPAFFVGMFPANATDAPWPLPNVWLGVSAENQEQADKRIPLLLQTPAAVRFISAEPLLGPIDISKFLTAGDSANPTGALNTHGQTGSEANSADTLGPANMEAVAKNVGAIRQEADRPAVRKLDWVIVGGESGPGARPFQVEWARALVNQCREANAPVFVKQLGADPRENIDRIDLEDLKGGDMAEWPVDLRVREMPVSRGA